MNSTVTDVFMKMLTRVFGSKHARDIKALQPYVDEINSFYDRLSTLTDEEIKGKTDEFRKRLDEGETLDDIMTEAFAVVKEVCRRLIGKKWLVIGNEITWDMVPYDCQLIGAIVLHHGKITEMVTGEGKSLVATMPLYLNSLTGKGVHFITVNDYLVQRDVEWYGKIYEMLGVSVGYIVHDMSNEDRKAAYACDITYGTNNEFGFDYLRDNMAIRIEDIVQRDFNYALVDENPSNEDTDYIETDTATNTDLYNYEDLTGVDQTVYGIQINTQARVTDASAKDLQNVAYSVTTLSPSATLSVTDTSFKTFSSIEETDPATGALWLAAAVNAAQFGVKMV